MSILFYDGFESFDPANPFVHWDTGINPTFFLIDATGGRRSSAGLVSETATRILIKGTTSDDVALAGVAYKPPLTISSTGTILMFYLNASPQIHIRAETDGRITVRRGENGTQLGITTSPLLIPGDYAFVECRVFIDNSIGTVEVRVNRTTVISVTGMDTQALTTALVNQVGIGGQAGGAGATLDDFYIVDEAGPAPYNTFLGDIRVDTLRPTADGAVLAIPTIFPVSPVTQFDKIDEAINDEETTYIESTGSGQISTFIYDDLPVVPGGAAVFAVQINSRVRKTSSGGAAVNSIVRSGAVNRVLGSHSITDDYLQARTVHIIDPATGSDWIDSNIDAAEFGLEVV